MPRRQFTDNDRHSQIFAIYVGSEKIGRLREPSALVAVCRASIFVQNWGASAIVEDLQKNERKTRNQGRNTNPSNEGLADAVAMPVARKSAARSSQRSRRASEKMSSVPASPSRDIIGEVRHFQQSPAPCHPGLEYRLDCGQTVYVEGCYVSPSAVGYLAGRRQAIRADLVKRLPERAREQFPGIGGVYVKPVPDGKLPVFVFMVSLVCYQPVSDPAADFSGLVVCSLVDDLDTNLPALIEREIRDLDWDQCAMDGNY